MRGQRYINDAVSKIITVPVREREVVVAKPGVGNASSRTAPAALIVIAVLAVIEVITSLSLSSIDMAVVDMDDTSISVAHSLLTTNVADVALRCEAITLVGLGPDRTRAAEHASALRALLADTVVETAHVVAGSLGDSAECRWFSSHADALLALRLPHSRSSDRVARIHVSLTRIERSSSGGSGGSDAALERSSSKRILTSSNLPVQIALIATLCAVTRIRSDRAASTTTSPCSSHVLARPP